MPSLTFPKSALGAVVDVKLLPSSARLKVWTAGSPAPGPVSLKMLIDTGAEYSAVDKAKIDHWQLYPSTFYLSQSMTGTASVPVYDLCLEIHGLNGQFSWVLDPLQVTGRVNNPFDQMPYSGVIGRDVLDRGSLLYDGLRSVCTISY